MCDFYFVDDWWCFVDDEVVCFKGCGEVIGERMGCLFGCCNVGEINVVD